LSAGGPLIIAGVPESEQGESVSGRGRPALIVALVATHNRREMTLRCLRSYFGQSVPDATLRAVIVDGGSQDGTPSAVSAEFADADVVRGGNDLYWAGAMWTAEQRALARDPDYLLWLNDDVVLDGDALRELLATASERHDRCVVVGAMRDPRSGDVTYSGIMRPGRHPMRVQRVRPRGETQVVDTFNGNLVLVPRAIGEVIGPIDGRYVHSGADFDYGYRAKKLGIPTVLAPGTLGQCERDGDLHPWANRGLTRRERLAILRSPKGHPFRPRGRFMRRHAGRLAPFFLARLYIRAIGQVLAPIGAGCQQVASTIRSRSRSLLGRGEGSGSSR
jgi:GT2 family glycosyltransferase